MSSTQAIEAPSCADEEDVWISTAEAARVMRLSDRHVRRTLDRYVTRSTPGVNGLPAYEINLDSLPEDARLAYRLGLIPHDQADAPESALATDHPDDIIAAYQRADKRTKHH